MDLCSDNFGAAVKRFENMWCIDGRDPDPASMLVPGIEDGLRGMRFFTAAVESSRRDAAWTAVE